MAEISFNDRLSALGLDRFPEQDRDGLERLVRSIDEAALRVRGAYSYLEEPSNVFRLQPTAGEKGLAS
jgi:hypothetical protein